MSLILALALAASPAPASDILHYVRSNRDGSEPEHVVHFRPEPTRIAVYKWVEKCTTAAYVTAEMNAELRDARRFTAGKVARDGSQAAFGTLTLDASLPALDLEITPPGGERIEARHPLRSRPYLLYDFDFADLNAFLQEHRPKAAFSFELPLLWPGDPKLFRDLGRLDAAYRGEEQRDGRRTERFDLTLEGKATGALWTDAERGFIVEAELTVPNHAEYRDFRLRLEKVEPGSAAAWTALTRAHYESCPTGN